MIYFYLIIPVLLSLYSWFSLPRISKYKFPRDKKWLLIIGPFFIGLIIVFGSKFAVEKFQTTDTEWWTGWIVKSVYDEAWTEQQTYTTTDDKGNTQTHTIYIYHPPEYYVVDNNGCSVSVSYNEYLRLKNLFGNTHFETLFHFGQCSFGDGNRHYSNYPKTENTFVPVTTTHWYENRIIASHSVFKFPKVNPEGLYNYPKIYEYYKCPSVLWKDCDSKSEECLTKMNARLGKKKQVKVWFLVYEDVPIKVAYDQECYWQGGNKNELVITVGVDKNKKIDWCYCFSWTKREDCKLEIRDKVLEQKVLNISEIVKEIEPIIEEKFERRQFAEFSYLTVDPPVWFMMTLFVIMVIMSLFYIIYVEGICL